MLNRYYEQELANLRKLGSEFAQSNPALAPLLGADRASDPDVERLLEGVAFLTGLIRHRLEDDFPEFIQNLAQLLFPNFLRPLPCMTIMQYEPRMQLEEAVTVAADTEFSSAPIEGQRLVFRSSFPVTIEPVELTAAVWEGGGAQARTLRLRMRYTGIKAGSWKNDSLRFFLGGAHADATRLYLLLMRHVREVRISSEGGPVASLPPSCIKPAGLNPDLGLLPWPGNAHPAWRILHEYFALPEKLLFIDLSGFSRWPGRSVARDFSVQFLFDHVPDWAPSVGRDSFVMNATPAANLVNVDAHPIRVDHRQPDYKIQPVARSNRQAEQIYAVKQVLARSPDGQEQEYHSFSAFRGDDSTSYNLRIRPSALGRGYDHYLSLPYVPQADPQPLTLSARLSCTHGHLPEGLRLGDISEPTDKSPPRIAFRNILGVTPYSPPTFDSALLWRVLSHLNANHLSLATDNQLQDLLSLYLPSRQSSVQRHAAARRMISSIESIGVEPVRRMVRGMPVQGSEVTIKCQGDHFPGVGSMFLFGTVLDELLAGTVALNTFSALTLVDTVNGETLKWPAKTGRYRLL
ncbi:type VI secretion system baseplate subunit TssF [Pollutimonas harenae]|uniref:Type VI secretion system baseplate subunit TssF n=1 Tax=Pollutimonas harenae TaxID=657015 RepID=A0A853H0A3_9BURK|nr:type VI secretion system baseplate subunit TssF [Pollutimonas harenae]NYT85129.1 type VI secretion system baseplate subunit TssF [Pollutimonas harenae]TEA72489.1 type VI secretion system baseplate subunit TssF [Pollutimonas harenae]